MEIKNFTITKRDGSKEKFSLDKIMNAILKAFESVNEPTDLGMVSKILSDLNIHNDIKVEDIQNQVEEALMKEGFYKVAKSFIVYRQQHTEDRETVEKIKFLTDYCVAQNAATGSKFDANANVENKNIATLIGELPKQGFIRLNRRMLVDRIKKMYGKELADEYINLLRMTRRTLPTTVLPSPCTHGSSVEQHPLAVTLQPQPTSRASVVGLSTWSSWYHPCLPEPVQHQSS